MAAWIDGEHVAADVPVAIRPSAPPSATAICTVWAALDRLGPRCICPKPEGSQLTLDASCPVHFRDGALDVSAVGAKGFTVIYRNPEPRNPVLRMIEQDRRLTWRAMNRRTA